MRIPGFHSEARRPNWQRFARMACILLPIAGDHQRPAHPLAELAAFCTDGVHFAANSR